MSPEQVNGVAVDARSDLFSMGVILYRAAVGKLPFSGKGFAVIADQILNETPAPPRKEDPEIPEALESIILKSLAKERDDRYVSAREILKDLDALRESLGIAADALPIIEGDTLAKPAREASPKTPNPTTSTGEHSSVGDASVLEFQGEGKSNPNIPQKAAPALAPAQAAPAPAPNRTPLMVGLALVAALGIGAVFVLGMGGGNSTPNPTPAPTPAPAPAEKTFEELRSDKEALRSLARKKIDEEITSGDSPKLLAMAKALDAVGTPRSAPFLYKLVAMSGPDIKKTAAYALRDLKLPEAAPQVREGLSNADKNTKIHLSGVMLALGDKDAKPSLQKELSGPVALKLAAAKALAKAGEKEPADIVAILQEAMQGPEGSQFWLDGAEGLAALGDETAKTKLQEARAKPDEKLVLSVLSLLSQGGDTEAKAQLARNVENPDYARRYEAALILARLGDPAGIGAAKEGAKAPDPVDRAASLATLGRFPSAANAVDVLIEATRDSDLVVRYTALAALLAIE
jgi:HEAT repeat protein